LLVPGIFTPSQKKQIIFFALQKSSWKFPKSWTICHSRALTIELLDLEKNIWGTKCRHEIERAIHYFLFFTRTYHNLTKFFVGSSALDFPSKLSRSSRLLFE